MVDTELNDLVYLFVPTGTVESKNVKPEIIENGHKVRLTFSWSESYIQMVEQFCKDDIVKAGFRRSLKKMFQQKGLARNQQLVTTLDIPLPFQCEQQFYEAESLLLYKSRYGYQIFQGLNEDGEKAPIFQACLCKTKDNFDVEEGNRMQVVTLGAPGPSYTPQPKSSTTRNNIPHHQQATQQQRSQQQHQHLHQQQLHQQQLQQQQFQKQQFQKQFQEQKRQLQQQQKILTRQRTQCARIKKLQDDYEETVKKTLSPDRLSSFLNATDEDALERNLDFFKTWALDEEKLSKREKKESDSVSELNFNSPGESSFASAEQSLSGKRQAVVVEEVSDEKDDDGNVNMLEKFTLMVQSPFKMQKTGHY